MILGVAYHSPWDFFEEASMNGVYIDLDAVTCATSLHEMGSSSGNSGNIILFEGPNVLVRMSPIINFDYKASSGEFRPPLWSLASLLHTRSQLPAPKVKKEEFSMDALISQEREKDLLDKINVIVATSPRIKRKSIEKILFAHLASGTTSLTVEQIAEQLFRKVSYEKSELIALSQAVAWFSTPFCKRLIRGLKELMGESDWRAEASKIAIKHGIRAFELGYIMSFFDKEGRPDG